jgi:hypothetical protein
MAKVPYLAHRTNILGHSWTVYYCTEGFFKKKYGKECLGVTETDDKQIYLRVKKLKSEVVIHELVHAYMEELCTTPAGLAPEQVEEVAADLFGKYGAKILRQSQQIIDAYHVLRERASSSGSA